MESRQRKHLRGNNMQKGKDNTHLYHVGNTYLEKKRERRQDMQKRKTENGYATVHCGAFPKQLWLRFAGRAKENGKTIKEALIEALDIWLRKG